MLSNRYFAMFFFSRIKFFNCKFCSTYLPNLANFASFAISQVCIEIYRSFVIFKWINGRLTGIYDEGRHNNRALRRVDVSLVKMSVELKKHPRLLS